MSLNMLKETQSLHPVLVPRICCRGVYHFAEFRQTIDTYMSVCHWLIVQASFLSLVSGGPQCLFQVELGLHRSKNLPQKPQKALFQAAASHSLWKTRSSFWSLLQAILRFVAVLCITDEAFRTS